MKIKKYFNYAMLSVLLFGSFASSNVSHAAEGGLEEVVETCPDYLEECLSKLEEEGRLPYLGDGQFNYDGKEYHIKRSYVDQRIANADRLQKLINDNGLVLLSVAKKYLHITKSGSHLIICEDAGNTLDKLCEDGKRFVSNYREDIKAELAVVKRIGKFCDFHLRNLTFKKDPETGIEKLIFIDTKDYSFLRDDLTAEDVSYFEKCYKDFLENLKKI